jgi:hypothetical protein
MQISRKTKESKQNTAVFLDTNDGNDDSQTIYCQKCYRVNVLSVLQPRLYNADQPLPHDTQNWKMCYRYGKIVSVNDVKHDTEISEVVEPVNDNEPHFAGIKQN